MRAGHLAGGAGQQLVQQPGVGDRHRVGGVVVLQLGAVQRVRLQPEKNVMVMRNVNNVNT